VGLCGGIEQVFERSWEA